MNRKLRIALIILLTAVLLASVGLFLRRMYYYRLSKENAQIAQSMAIPSASGSAPESKPQPNPDEETGISEAEPSLGTANLPEDVSFLQEVDLQALRTVNLQVVGWIHLPNSVISYPLMQAGNNELYLNASWDGNYNIAGSIFLETRNDPALTDFNTIIYGHRMSDGSMFSELHNYSDPAYWETHPYIYLVTDDAVRQYRVFSAYEAPVRSDTYRLQFADEAEKQRCINIYSTASVVASAITPTTDDLLLTLSTCTGSNSETSRWVVQTVLCGQWTR